jgi:AcrR family transcriptional regulator
VTRTPGARLSVDDWLLAGLDLLAADGLSAVKVEPLCTRLGVTKGSFYWHFEDLRSFLTALAQRWSEDRDAARAAFVTDVAQRDPLDRLRWMSTAMVQPRQISLERAIREWAVSDESVRAQVALHDRWGFAAVHQAFRDLGFTGDDADVRAKTLYFAGLGYIHSARLDLPDVPDHREGLLQILARK